MLVNNLISDKDEKSNAIKFSYLEAYSDLIVSHPSILILGQGAGSKFYSKDRKDMKFQTEWSYIEIFRMFGLFGFFYVLFLFFFPLFIIFKYRNIFEDAFPMMLGYLLYLIVGGTNPLLLGSTGMIVLLVTYSFYYDKISKYKFDLTGQEGLPLFSSVLFLK